MNFSLNFSGCGAECLPHRLPAHASFLSVFVVHVPAVLDLWGRLMQTYELHGLFFRPHFLLRRVCSSTHSYTDFPGLVQVVIDSECGASLHGQRTCSQAARLLVTVTLENRLSKAVTRETAPLQRSREGLARCLLSHVTLKMKALRSVETSGIIDART